LTKRERNIGIIAIGVLGSMCFYHFLLEPYQTRQGEITKQRRVVDDGLRQATSLFNREARLRKIWDDMQKEGLKLGEYDATSQAMHSVLEWARSAGVVVRTTKEDRARQVDPFEVISIHVTGVGPLRAVSRLIWSIETASIPVGISDVRINSAPEGTDNLTVQMTISTICLQSEKPGKTPVTAANWERGQP
jgi:hypothetical protein